MRFAGGLTAVLFGTAIIIGQPLIAAALKPEEIYPIAQKITVRIEGAGKGSGVIIERQGNIYTVLTNLHVVDQKGSYTVYTPDGKKCCTINRTQVTPLPNEVDLATFQFTSNENYRVAEEGTSDIRGGKPVYIAGYPAQTSSIPKGNFYFLSGQISSRIQNPQNGYALVYTVEALEGMSGGPILDEEGKLVGIHGSAGTDPVTGGTATLGIPLNTYLSLARSVKPSGGVLNPRPSIFDQPPYSRGAAIPVNPLNPKPSIFDQPPYNNAEFVLPPSYKLPPITLPRF